jgi:uncharacterized peroxidase-related enzyme
VTWIKHVSYEDAEGQLRKLYDRLKGTDNNIDNIMLAHSLRPHTMEGHMALYKQVLHHPRNKISRWFLEALGIYTSIVNKCHYCIEHHFQGMQRVLEDEARAQALRMALLSGQFSPEFNDKEAAALAYARKLTEAPGAMEADDVAALREAGWEDGEILEINQVTAYFNYANRTVLGLGINTDGDVLGLSPSDSTDTDNWNHR